MFETDYVTEQINQNKDLEKIFNILQQSDEEFLNKQINTKLFESVRAPNAFERNNIKTYGDILKLGKEGLYNIEWLGRKTLRDIARVIELDKYYKEKKDCFVNYRETLINQLKGYDFSTIENNNLSKDQFDLLLNELNKYMFNFLENSVTERQLLVFKYRLLDNLTLEQIGVKYGLSRERIRQLVLKVTRIIERNFCTNDYEDKSSFINDYYELLTEVEPEYIVSTIENLLFTESVHSTIIKRVLSAASININAIKTKPLIVDIPVKETNPQQSNSTYSKMSRNQKEFIKNFTIWLSRKYPEIYRYFLYGIPQYAVPKAFSKPLFWFVLGKDSSLKFKYYSNFRNDEKPESIIVNVDEPTLVYTKVDGIMKQLFNHID